MGRNNGVGRKWPIDDGRALLCVGPSSGRDGPGEYEFLILITQVGVEAASSRVCLLCWSRTWLIGAGDDALESATRRADRGEQKIWAQLMPLLLLLLLWNAEFSHGKWFLKWQHRQNQLRP